MSQSRPDQPFEQWVAQILTDAAGELRQNGWDVVELKGRQVDWLPASLQRFQPDIVARRGNELLIGEVKSRNSEELEDLDDLAKAVAEVPNARLEVYWLGDETESKLARERVQEYSDEAKTLIGAGHLAAAVLVAWAAVEGGLLYYATNARISLPDPGYAQAPWQLLSHLDSLGYINDADLKRFAELRKQRNATAHFAGRENPPNPADIEYCLEIVDRMLSGRYVSVDQMEEWFSEHYDYPEVPIRDAERSRIQAVLSERFPGVPESDISEAVKRIVQVAGI